MNLNQNQTAVIVEQLIKHGRNAAQEATEAIIMTEQYGMLRTLERWQPSTRYERVCYCCTNEAHPASEPVSLERAMVLKLYKEHDEKTNTIDKHLRCSCCIKAKLL